MDPPPAAPPQPGAATSSAAASAAPAEATPAARRRRPPVDGVTLLVGPSEDAFVLSRGDLLRHPDSMLGAMFSDASRPLWEGKGPHRFPDRDPGVFAAVAAFYESGGRLEPPSHHPDVYRELDFWRVEPAVGPLLAERSAARGVVLADHLDALVQLVMEELRDDLLAAAVTGTPCTVFAVRPALRALRDVTAVVEAAKAPSLFDRHSPSACDDCAAGRVAHFWPDDPPQTHLREMLEVCLGKLRTAQQPRGELAAQAAQAADFVFDAVVAKLLLSGNAAFQHRLRVALALVGVEAAFERVETDDYIPEEHLRLGGRVRDGCIAVWTAPRVPPPVTAVSSSSSQVAAAAAEPAPITAAPSPKPLLMYTRIALTPR